MSDYKLKNKYYISQSCIEDAGFFNDISEVEDCFSQDLNPTSSAVTLYEMTITRVMKIEAPLVISDASSPKPKKAKKKAKK